MKKGVMVVVLFLLVVSMFVSAAADVSAQEECGFFCKAGKWWNEFRGEEL